MLSPRQGQQIQAQPAGNINFIGASGQQPLQFQGINPVPFDIGQAMPDNTQALFERQDQAVQQAYAANQSVIESSLRANQARAEASTQSGFAGAIAGIGQAVAAGLELREQARQRKATELQGLLENDIRNRIVDLHSVVTQEGEDNGEFQAMRTMLNELSSNYGGTLSTEQITALRNIGWDALSSVSQRRATGKLELLQQARELTVSNHLANFELDLATMGVQVENGQMPPQQLLDAAQQYMTTTAESGNFSDMEIVEMWTQLRQEMRPYIENHTRDITEYDRRTTLAQQLISSVYDIQNSNLSPEQKASQIALLQVEASRNDLGIQLPSVFPTRAETLAEYNRTREQELAVHETVIETLLQEPDYSRAFGQAATGQALAMIRSAQNGELARFSREGNVFQRHIAEQATALQTDHERVLELNNEWSSLQVQAAEARNLVATARRRANPSEMLGVLRTLDPALLRLLPVEGMLERGTISAEEYENVVRTAEVQFNRIEQEMSQLRNTRSSIIGGWQQRQIDIEQLTPSNQDAWNQSLIQSQEFVNQRNTAEQERITNSPGLAFSQGTGITPPASVPLKRTPEGQTLPLIAESNYTVTSEYGMRTHPVHGGRRMHYGIDIVLQGNDTRVRSIQGGTVVRALTNCRVGDRNCGGGFGNFVIVRTPSGHYEQFNHVGATYVGEGQTINPGDPLADMGNTGVSTGAHLDFMVYKPGTQESQLAAGGYANTTINPREYFGLVTNLEPVPHGAGAPIHSVGGPADIPENIARNFTLQELFRYTPANGGAIETSPNVYESPERVYNNANPRRRQNISVWRSAYPEANDSSANYGYQELSNNRDFREALTSTANRLNIPAQWLADVIELETTNFSPARRNSQGAIGLIQFHPSGGLADVAQWMGTSVSNARERLARMTHAEQMQYVERYLHTYGPGAGHTFEHVSDLYGLVNQGPSYWRRGRQRSQSVHDGSNSLSTLLQRLGRAVGRRYNFDDRQSSSRRTHTHATGYCAECSRQMNNFGRVLPHYQEIA